MQGFVLGNFALGKTYVEGGFVFDDNGCQYKHITHFFLALAEVDFAQTDAQLLSQLPLAYVWIDFHFLDDLVARVVG